MAEWPKIDGNERNMIHLTRRQQLLIGTSAVAVFILAELSAYLLGDMRTVGDVLRPIFYAGVIWLFLALWASRATRLIELEKASHQQLEQLVDDYVHKKASEQQQTRNRTGQSGTG